MDDRVYGIVFSYFPGQFDVWSRKDLLKAFNLNQKYIRDKDLYVCVA